MGGASIYELHAIVLPPRQKSSVENWSDFIEGKIYNFPFQALQIRFAENLFSKLIA